MTRKEELLEKIAQHIYPTNQIMGGEITLEEYIKGITDCLVNEIESRHIPKKMLPLLAELALLNTNKKEVLHMPKKPIVPFVTTTTAKKNAQEEALSSKNMLKKIEDNLRERMSWYTDSRQPTDDEVTIAWLVSEVDRLNKIIKTQAINTPVIDMPEEIKTTILTEREISEKILFGNENPATVLNEIMSGKRPSGWNIAGHPDHDIWVKVLFAQQSKNQ